MWANYLVGTDNFFSSRDDLPIRFGQLETFAVDRGVDDLAWRRSANTTQRESSITPSLFEAS